MGQFNDKILAEFQPPKKWKLGRDLSYTTSDLTSDEVRSLHGVGVAVVRDTNKTETITENGVVISTKEIKVCEETTYISNGFWNDLINSEQGNELFWNTLIAIYSLTGG